MFVNFCLDLKNCCLLPFPFSIFLKNHESNYLDHLITQMSMLDLYDWLEVNFCSLSLSLSLSLSHTHTHMLGLVAKTNLNPVTGW